jgi:hypothetical protein
MFLHGLVISRLDAGILLIVFAVLMVWIIIIGRKNSRDALAREFRQEQNTAQMPVALTRSRDMIVMGVLTVPLVSTA